MAKRKKSRLSFVVTLAVLSFLLVALGITVFAVQQRQDLLSFAKSAAERCPKIPTGNYNVKVKTYASTPWELSCPFPGGNRSGEIPPTTIPLGYRWVPEIRKGDKYTVETTLKQICTSSGVVIGWSDICQICQSIDCTQVKISGNLAVQQIECKLGAYQAFGRGDISLTYRGSGLGACTASAAYKGKLTGSFIVGITE